MRLLRELPIPYRFKAWLKRSGDLEAEYIGDTRDVLRALSMCPEACRRLARAIDLDGDVEAGDFLRQQAENEAHRADAEQKQAWADQAARKVRP